MVALTIQKPRVDLTNRPQLDLEVVGLGVRGDEAMLAPGAAVDLAEVRETRVVPGGSHPCLVYATVVGRVVVRKELHGYRTMVYVCPGAVRAPGSLGRYHVDDDAATDRELTTLRCIG